MKKKDFIALFVILLIAVLFRTYQLRAPLSDAYSWRQADTAAVARNFTRTGFNLLSPRYDDLSSVQSGFENPQGFRFVEFPLYNAIFGFAYKLAPIFTIEVWGRIISIIFSLCIISVLYYLCLHETGRLSAIFASFIYSVFPAFVFFSRVVLPETPALSLSFVSIFLLYRFNISKTSQNIQLFYLLGSSLLFACAVLVKPTAIFYVIPLVYIFIRKYEFDVIKKLQPYIFFGIALLPLLLWRLYIQKYPEGIPASDWLITHVNTFEGQKNIFFKPAFFRWIFFERISTMIFGGYLTVFFILGILKKNRSLFLHTLLTSATLYLFVFQGGNVQHEYYQALILPPLAIFAGIGIATVLSNRSLFFHPAISGTITLIVMIFSFLFSYYYKVKDFYTYPQDLNMMAKIIQTFTKPGDKIVADRMGDTTLLYLADRKGSALLNKNRDDLVKEGYSYVLTDQKQSISTLSQEPNVTILFQNNQFALLKL